MFSIIIPTLNNLNHLKLCIDSIKKNSALKNEIIIHVSMGNDGTREYLKEQNINHTFTDYNAGIAEGANSAAKNCKNDYILYSHDDFYFCPNWDLILKKEIENIGHKKFYLSGTMVGATPKDGIIIFDSGKSYQDFDEKKFLENYKRYNTSDFQGSHWAPHVIHKDIWNSVGGFSLEFWPGAGTDPDLAMKLWKHGVRIFKGINDFKVYHFGSVISRKSEKNTKEKKWSGTKASKMFLLKWGISMKFFKKFIIMSNTKYLGELPDKPKINFTYILSMFLNKINYIYVKFIYKNFNTHKHL